MKTTAFLIRVLICFLLSLVPLNDLEQRVYSARMRLRGAREAARNVVIVELDGAAFRTLKRRYVPVTDLPEPDRFAGFRELFAWDPNVFRELLRELLARKPQAVAVTWHIPSEVMDSFSDPGLENVARDRRVIWSSQFGLDGGYQRPSRRIARGDNFGFNNLSADSDGTVRRSTLRRQEQNSLTAAVAELAGVSARRPGEAYFINFMGPSGSVTYCPVLEVLGRNPRPQCADLRNRVVLLSREGHRPTAATSLAQPLAGGYFQTPLGEMNRAEVLANEIDTVVNGRRIYRASIAEVSLIILALVLFGAFSIVYYPVLVSSIILGATGLIIIGPVSQGVFTWLDAYVPSVNLGLSLLITYLVFTGYRLAFQENLQWRTFKQAQYLRELDTMKSNFLSLVSHDLKTPLAKIQAAVDRLRREPASPEALGSIDNSTGELRHYITSILNLSRIESQKVILNRKSNDINRIIEQTLKRLKPLAVSRQIEVVAELEPLFAVECDEELMKQVLANLIDNAIKYSPQGSKVIVRSREEPGFVGVEVEDFGRGIPKDQLPMLFRKFQRFLQPMGEATKGTGLGLYLSKYFIELHGGSIRVKSVEGKGTVFSFSLPIERASS